MFHLLLAETLISAPISLHFSQSLHDLWHLSRSSDPSTAANAGILTPESESDPCILIHDEISTKFVIEHLCLLSILITFFLDLVFTVYFRFHWCTTAYDNFIRCSFAFVEITCSSQAILLNWSPWLHWIIQWQKMKVTSIVPTQPLHFGQLRQVIMANDENRSFGTVDSRYQSWNSALKAVVTYGKNMRTKWHELTQLR